jgi:hypothetical protein
MTGTGAMARSAALQSFLDGAARAALASARAGSAAERAVEEVFDRCAAKVGAVRGGDGVRLPVCDWLGPALAAAADTQRAQVGVALGAIASGLRWTRRSSADPSEPVFWNGHANAMIMGPGGIEERDDLWIGVTLMAPDITYVDHDHPPEEVYLSLSPGQWWNAEMDWTDPGMTGLIYNPPGIRHAMRSGAKPFLALWFLPL